MMTTEPLPKLEKTVKLSEMKKAIVTTTINPPTKALKKFIEIAERDNWHIWAVGDRKTPHDKHLELEKKHECYTYVTPDQQKSGFPELSDLLGWDCIQRRNIGLILAWQNGSEIIATVDDDNIPHAHWGSGCMVGKVGEILHFKSVDCPVFDPLSLTHPQLWHRGFPVQLLGKRRIQESGRVSRKVLVQADLWDGDPDIDAVCRIALAPNVKFNPSMPPFCSDTLGPFNSQNTFLHRDLFPTYFLFPHVGRMDDIWASYVTQFKFPDSVIYSRASVTQERNDHDLVKDLEAELLGYRHNADFVVSPDTWEKFLPEQSLKAYEAYKECFA